MKQIVRRTRQKTKAVVVAVSMALQAFNLSGVGKFVKAEDTDITIPTYLYADKTDLKGFSAEGTAGYISFGYRAAEATYNVKEDDATVSATANVEPLQWRIAGYTEDSGLVLYSKEPVLSAMAFNSDSSKGNSWEISGLREAMSNLAPVTDNPTDNDYFTATEQKMIATSTIETYSYTSASTYTTEDKLYAPRAVMGENGTPSQDVDDITVGEKDDILLPGSDFTAFMWTRSPYSAGGVMVAAPVANVGVHGVAQTTAAPFCAFRLDVDSVLFASTASASNEEGFVVSTASTSDPMILRVKSQEGSLDDAKIESEDYVGVFKYSAPANSRLMIVAMDENGVSYQYSKTFAEKVEDQTFNLMKDVEGLPEDTIIKTKAWIETDAVVHNDSCTLVYAVTPIDVSVMKIEIEDLTREYNGMEIEPRYSIWNGNTGERCYPDVEITYYPNTGEETDKTALGSAPKDAGKYRITVKVKDANFDEVSAEKEFEIVRANWSIDFGELQQVKNTTDKGGVDVTVKPTINGVYLDSVTAESDRTTYVTSAGYEDPVTASATVTIDYYQLKEMTKANEDSSESATTNFTTAGSYVVRVTIAESTNYNAASEELGFNIASNEAGSVEITAAGDKVYDGKPVAEPTLQFKDKDKNNTEKSESCVVTYEYTLAQYDEENSKWIAINESEYDTIAPIDVGEYMLRVTASPASEESDNMVATEHLTISRAAVTVNVYLGKR